jgi:chemotaxis methyl-accepting protein methylase
MDDNQFRTVLDHLGYSWAGYRKVRKGVKKRIHRHMQQLGCRNITDYLNLLDQKEERRQECELLMTVSVSRFFRDRQFWQTLEQKWLPAMIVKNPSKLKVWSAGCARGEEAYSFIIVWESLGEHIESMPQLKILATDRNPRYLEQARNGIYSLSSLKEIPLDRRSAFFKSRKAGKQFVIRDSLKNNIEWKVHHLLTDPPGSDYDLIFLRNNVLTYYRKAGQRRALDGILNYLSPNGLLIIGCHETLPFATSSLAAMPPFSYVFQKNE